MGQALVAAKRQYLEETGEFGGIHEKALLEVALFGLPIDGGSFRLSAKLRVILVGSLSHPAAEPLSGLRDLFDIVEVPDIGQAQRQLREGGYAAMLCAGPTLPEGLHRGCPGWDGRILEDVPDGVALVDGDGKLVWVNARFRQLCRRDDVVGEGLYEAFGSPLILGPDFSPFAMALVTGEAATTKLQIGEKDFCQLHASTISGLSGGEEKKRFNRRIRWIERLERAKRWRILRESLLD